MQRRTFLKTALAAGAAAPFAHAQPASPAPDWGGSVIDTHLHLRPDAEACYTHMQGCGVSHALLLTPDSGQDRARQAMEKRPGHFARSVSTNPAAPDAAQKLRSALSAGAVSIGELKFHLDLDSPEMTRVYDIAAEMRVPVMMHIQVFPHFPGELPYNTKFPEFDKVLKAHPKTTFIGHGDFFWANISSNVPLDRGYPDGPVKPGGLTDRFLSDFPNLYGDLSANSGNNALSRDPAFTKDFLLRHRAKLMFGSDCSCSDGNGAGISQGNNPEAARLSGKCVARETLAVLKKNSSPEVFRQITWSNAVKLYRIFS